MNQSTHFNEHGETRMVDVTAKPSTARTATASTTIEMSGQAAESVRQGSSRKGDVLAVARLAAIGAAKLTSTLIPLCHAIPIEGVEVEFDWCSPGLEMVKHEHDAGTTKTNPGSLPPASRDRAALDEPRPRPREGSENELSASFPGEGTSTNAIRRADPLPNLASLDSTSPSSAGRGLSRKYEALRCRVTVRTTYKTGVEMEAMTAASVAALTVYDMLKSVDRAIVIRETLLEHKDGGKSGEFRRD